MPMSSVSAVCCSNSVLTPSHSTDCNFPIKPVLIIQHADRCAPSLLQRFFEFNHIHYNILQLDHAKSNEYPAFPHNLINWLFGF